MYRLHFQNRKIVQQISEKAGGKQLNGLHGIISQKMILFIITAVKTSNPTYKDHFDRIGDERLKIRYYCIKPGEEGILEDQE
jgi:hypothetical protein